MAWDIGICSKCNYSVPDQYGATHYCVFRVRARRFSLLRLRMVRYWTWLCGECDSDTTKQARRNKPTHTGEPQP